MADSNLTKYCACCKSTKRRIGFYNNRSKPDGLSTICKPCTNISNKESTRRGREKRRQMPGYSEWLKNYALQTKYGISLKEYKSLVEQQGGACALCGHSPKVLCVDHCHETGAVRGLLCASCNQALGKLGDTETGILKALDYLRGGK